MMLGGCATVDRGSIPVVDASGSVYDQQAGRQPATAASAPQAATARAPVSAQDSGVVVMVPGGGASRPIQVSPASADVTPLSSSVSQAGAGIANGVYSSASVAPSGIPGTGSGISGGLAADEQLDGPVLALLTTARQEQGSGNLDSAASSLERAQRIAPREPQVLYRLAEVRLAQGDAAQAEQLARRGLTYASGRPALQASLWNLIAQARDRQGDAAGAAQARERARVNL